MALFVYSLQEIRKRLHRSNILDSEIELHEMYDPGKSKILENFIQLVLAILPNVLRDKAEQVAVEQSTTIIQICRQLDPSKLPQNKLEKAAKNFCFYATGKSRVPPKWLDLTWWEAVRSGR